MNALQEVMAKLFRGIHRVDAVRATTASERSEAENRVLNLMYDPVREGGWEAPGHTHDKAADWHGPQGSSPPMIDPPEGHAYGFPKSAPTSAEAGPFLAGLKEWLVENGYPEEFIDRYDAGRTTRIIGRFTDEPEC